MDPVGVTQQSSGKGGDPVFLHLPELNAAIRTTTGQQVPIGTPCDCVDNRSARTRQGLHWLAGCYVPQPDRGIDATTGEGLPIRSKGYTEDEARMPGGP